MVDVFCTSCPSNKYTLFAGNATFVSSVYFGNVEYTVKHVKCLKCPFGSICDKGRIHAANNFWGYRLNNELRFVTCPFRYCCTDNICTGYNSCSLGRHGTLCNVCDKNRVENVMNSNCLEARSCTRPWLWVIVILGGMFYFVALTFTEEIFMFLKRLLLPGGISCAIKRISTSEHEDLYLINSDCNQEISMQASQDVDDSDEGLKQETLFSAFFKIIVYFYQTCMLYKIHFMSEKSHSLLQLAKEIISSLFNLRIDGQFYQNISWCPFKDLRPVSKVLFKMSFVLYLIILTLFAYLLSKVLGKLCKHLAHQSHLMTNPLLKCSLRLILISYATVTSGLFSLVSCIPIYPPAQTVLFIDGAIQCYQWWQYIVILTLICWIICFPIALYSSSWLLYRNNISVTKFVLSMVFPLAAIFYWIYLRCCSSKLSEPLYEGNDQVAETPQEGIDAQQITPEALFDIIAGPFRELKTNVRDKNFKLPWESVLVATKLILIFAKNFVFNTVVRLYVMLAFTVLFLIHHVEVQPFSNGSLNYIETGSLFMLSAICGLNIISAYNYMYPASVSPFSLKSFWCICQNRDSLNASVSHHSRLLFSCNIFQQNLSGYLSALQCGC